MEKIAITKIEIIKLRQASNTAKILQLLKKKKVATNVELNKICYRYAARIHELRREGHVIVSNHVEAGLWSYHYMGERQEDAQ